ncbi:HNH endonuclease signature motif containing protein [Cuniculiplasma sp. SKW3]|uniref:HNH endonuclease signature motif containing protein n=1 Tax=Cuniculiplasma sp. SKW3 TaxID=3400170 RepID=UPI003FD3E5F7
MINQILLSSKIYDSLIKAKETMDNEYQETFNWITDIIENENRPKYNECEICGSSKKLELHHARGRKHGNETITVCQECHKILTDKQRLWDSSWLDPNAENKGAFLILGLIDVCELKHQRTGKEIFKRFAEKLTEGFAYE